MSDESLKARIEKLQQTLNEYLKESNCDHVEVVVSPGNPTIVIPEWTTREEAEEAIRPVVVELKAIRADRTFLLERQRAKGLGIRTLLDYYLECPVRTDFSEEERQRVEAVVQVLKAAGKEDIAQLEEVLMTSGWDEIYSQLAVVLCGTSDVMGGEISVRITSTPIPDSEGIAYILDHLLPREIHLANIREGDTAKLGEVLAGVAFVYEELLGHTVHSRGFVHLLKDAGEALDAYVGWQTTKEKE